MNSECSICFEIVRSTETQKPYVTRCGHIFHENCIKNCFKDVTYGKCPQCNQTVITAHLIRLFVNEPENSIRAKDELIEQLKVQLNELNEKAQLQYDLIGSLNRQISLERELNQNAEVAGSRQKATSTSHRINSRKDLLAPAVLNVQEKPNLGVRSKNVAISRSSIVKPVPSFPTESMSQSRFGFESINVFANEKDNVTFNFDATNSTEGEPLGAVGLGAPNWRASQHPISTFSFGSKPTLETFNSTNFKFMPSNSSKCTSTFGQGSEASGLQIPTMTSSQNTNIFSPIPTKKGSTSRPLFKFKPPSLPTIATSKSFTNFSSSSVSFNFSPSLTGSLDEDVVAPSQLENFFRNFPKPSTLCGSTIFATDPKSTGVIKSEKVSPEKKDS